MPNRYLLRVTHSRTAAVAAARGRHLPAAGGAA